MSQEPYSLNDIYYHNVSTDLTVEQFGVLTTNRLDAWYQVAGKPTRTLQTAVADDADKKNDKKDADGDNYNTEKEAVYIIKDGSGVGTVSYVTGKCSATGTLNTLQAKEGYSLQYLYYMLKVFNFEPYKTGMAIPHIYFKDYGKAKIFCPSYTEQLKYARLLSAIDNKLSAEQSILTDLSLQKQYLLRQMFI